MSGHNLDDEAAVLLGNVLRWDAGYLGRQQPVLAASNGFARKEKPLIRLAERETAAYCVLRGIDYIVEECPMSGGNKHLGYKDALNAIELQSHLLAPPVEVGLIVEKVVEVVLTGGFVEGPRGTTEHAHPVVRWPTVGRRICPDVPISFGVVTRRS